MRRTRALRGLIAALAVSLLAACSATTVRTQAPPGGLPAAGPSPTPSCNAEASIRPPAAMPAPGQMPAGTFMKTIQNQGKLIAGVSSDTLLFSYLNPFDAKIEGFDVDVLNQVAQAIFGDIATNPSRLQLVSITNAQRIPELVGGTVNIVADTFTVNCDRRNQIDFSTIYYEAGQRVLVRSDSAAKSIADLSGDKVCAAAGSTSIANIPTANPKAIPVTVPEFTDCLVQLQNDQVDAISTDDAILAGLEAQDPYTKVIGPRFTAEPYGLGIQLGHPEFTAFVDGVIAQMIANGTWLNLYNKWLAPHLGPAPAPPAQQYK